jgi:hypothetical protein
MKQDIEYAALVQGIEIFAGYVSCVDHPAGDWYIAEPDKIMYTARAWRPLEDDGDSRGLEIACLQWMHSNDSNVPVHVWETDCQLDDARRAGNAQEYRAAVFALAVAIGKVISAGDAIDGGGV